MTGRRHRNNGVTHVPMSQVLRGVPEIRKGSSWVLVGDGVTREKISEILGITNEQALELIRRATEGAGSVRYKDFKLVYRSGYDIYRKV